MAFVLDTLVEILRKPTIVGVLSELMLFCGPLWVAIVVGLLVGWAWRPKWATDLVGGGKRKVDDAQYSPPDSSSGSGLAFGFPSLDSFKLQLPSCIASLLPDEGLGKEGDRVAARSPEVEIEKSTVTIEDFKHLCRLVEVTDGGPAWMHMMDKSLPNMTYQAWRRDPETGPPQYRSSTIFEDATPEIVRDFFWDDEFRTKAKWDDMLISHELLQECPKTGTMLVHWIRKFPFFCSDREYTIGRRIWNSGGSYYCVTKGVLYDAIPRRNKPRRVDLYYSSWCIRAVESKRGNGQLTACEVILFHHEDMGIPWEIAKLGIRQGMWGCVKKIESGLRAYQISRSSDEPLSRCAQLASINTKISADYMRSLETNDDASETEQTQENKPGGRNIPKFLVVGGAVVLACTLDRGLLTKALIFGVARRFVRRL